MLAEQRRVDIHQHLWPRPLLDALRARNSPPMLRGWTLHTTGEPPFDVDPADHDPAARAALEIGSHRVLLSLSTPLGIERLDPDDAAPLLDAWHAGVADLPLPFAGWAAVTETDPDLDGLEKLFGSGFVGLQISATSIAAPADLDAAAPVLRVCERLGKPVLVHPGPVAEPQPAAPAWWSAVVDYPAQLQAAWWTWRAAGRRLFPDLRICFAAGAGLAPVQHERFAARSGTRLPVDPDTFVEVSSYGRQAIDALSRALGIDVLVFGSDRPYAEPVDLSRLSLGAAAQAALGVVNPNRLLDGGVAA